MFSLCFRLLSSFIFILGEGDGGREDVQYSLAMQADKALFSSTFLLVSGRYMCLSYSWDSLSNGKHNLDSFRVSGVCIPCLLLSVLISHSYLPFSRDKFLKGIIKYVQYAILLLHLFRRCQD